MSAVSVGDLIKYDRVAGLTAIGVLTEVVKNDRNYNSVIGFKVEWIINGDMMLDVVFVSGYNVAWSKVEHKT